MKKVLIVGPKKSQHIQKWFSESDDLDLHLFTVDPGGSEFEPKVTEHTFRFINRSFSLLTCIPLFIYTWWKVRPDITNFHYLSSYGLLALFIPKKNLILNTWGSDVNKYYTRKNLHVWLIKKALRRFCWINAPAEHMKAKLISLNVEPNLIDVYQYGVPEYNRKVPNQSGVVKFISNRNWSDLYRIEHVVDAFIYFVDNYGANAKLYLYGGGGALMTKVESLLIQRPEIHDIIVVKGYTQHAVMLSEMKNMDIFVSVPRIDGMPLSLLEAMEIGLYPVVSDIDANHEWIDNDTGTICTNVENEKDLAESFHRAFRTVVNKSEDNNWESLNRNKVIERGRLKKNINKFRSKIESLN